MSLYTIILITALSGGCMLAGRLLFHYFQLESYQHPGYFRTIKRNFIKAFLPGLMLNAIWALASIAFSCRLPTDLSGAPSIVVSLVLLISGWLIGRMCQVQNAKKPLKFTPRIKRLYIVTFIVLAGLLILLSSLSRHRDKITVFGWIIWVFPLLLPALIALTGLIAWPGEKLISEMYFRDAQRILKGRNDLIRIGITGSWGKTSVKFILGTILEEKYHTLVTPSSFNTPMGVTRIIRSSLEPGHKVFIAEMGARHVGDIKELCRLVHPHLGILTSVGPQHLDTFRTVERVAKTKYELIEAIPENGKCFFADDDGICRKLFQQTKKEKYLSGLKPDDDVWAEDISSGPEGSRFILCTSDTRIPCETRLLGELNIRNIVLCASVAFSLGLSADQISRGIRKIQPVEHRLQLIPNTGGITLIDDAFNSNIRGAEQAFKVLSSFNPQRIVITPGMVELGKMEADMNREFGEMMASGCDIAILVGKKRSGAIAEGLRKQQFPEQNIHVTDSLEDAASLMRTMVRSGDTVLFENDLPDNYTE